MSAEFRTPNLIVKIISYLFDLIVESELNAETNHEIGVIRRLYDLFSVVRKSCRVDNAYIRNGQYSY